MSKMVFILGAGASKAVGAPVMAEFLDVAENLWASGMVKDEASQSFENVFKAIHALQAVYAKGYIDSRNLEAVFTAFEMAEVICKLPGFEDQHACHALLRDLRLVIVRTLEETTTVAKNDGTFSPAKPYADLVKFVGERLKPVVDSCAIITFNYDCALDYALHKGEMKIDYALEPRDGSPRDSYTIDLLKLHGSLNWAAEEQLDQRAAAAISVLQPRDFPFENPKRADRELRSRVSLRATFNARDRASQQRSGTAPLFGPVIVPPSWGKSAYYMQLSSVWRRAAIHLGEAEDIVIAGYSLPLTDEFFRNLFALGSIGPARLRRVWVFDKFPSQEMDARYRRLLGPLAQATYALFTCPFDLLTSILVRSGLEGMGEPPSQAIRFS